VSTVSKRILDSLAKSDYSEEVKELIRTLLIIELRHKGDKNPRYAEDYDRNIKRLAKFHEVEEG
jgi:hypothetical protein